MSYNTSIGLFLERDPIGYDDGMNVYQFVHGNPINMTDPTGLAGGGPGGSMNTDPKTGKETSKRDHPYLPGWGGIHESYTQIQVKVCDKQKAENLVDSLWNELSHFTSFNNNNAGTLVSTSTNGTATFLVTDPLAIVGSGALLLDDPFVVDLQRDQQNHVMNAHTRSGHPLNGTRQFGAGMTDAGCGCYTVWAYTHAFERGGNIAGWAGRDLGPGEADQKKTWDDYYSMLAAASGYPSTFTPTVVYNRPDLDYDPLR